MAFKLPASDKRTVIVGSTGSGKTFVACWLLSTRDWNVRPWHIIDFKGDTLLQDIDAKISNIYLPPPTKPGLYIYRPRYGWDDQALENWLIQVWQQGDCGLYVDEGYMIPKTSKAFRAIMTQGRSKNIEAITLIQRPVYVDRFLFSEANHIYAMRLLLKDDRERIGNYLNGAQIKDLPRFSSYWYNADDQEGAFLKPVPRRKDILRTFTTRRERQRGVTAI